MANYRQIRTDTESQDAVAAEAGVLRKVVDEWNNGPCGGTPLSVGATDWLKVQDPRDEVNAALAQEGRADVYELLPLPPPVVIVAFGAAAILVAPEAGIAGVAGGAVRLATALLG